jgi:hypothetical protein
VDSSKIADGSVATADLADGAVTKAKLSASGGNNGDVLKLSGGNLTWGQVQTGGLTLPYSGSANTGGVAFDVTNTGGGVAVQGTNSGNYGYLGGNAFGAYGRNSNSTYGFLGGATYGVFGWYFGNGNQGALGDSLAGVDGASSSGTGVFGHSTTGDGVRGYSDGGPNTAAVHGIAGTSNSTAIWGSGGKGTAGYFDGPVWVTGHLTKSGGGFKIDHPVDPDHKYLNHFFVESPDMKNVYDGVVTTDENGFAEIVLPEWFEALNRDFRYQLTVIDDSDRFVLAKVVQEIHDNRFTIRTNFGHVKVSWQVTGIRKDPWAEAHRIPVEEAKPPEEQGTYLHPKEWGQPEEKGRNYRILQKMREELAKHQEQMAKHQEEMAKHREEAAKLQAAASQK